MNYQNHYDRLIGRARDRILEVYSERHHIIPRCLGGSNAKENIVRLTPEEHYVAHQLLVKIHPGNHRLVYAAKAMTNKSKKQSARKNKLYGWLRRKFAEATSARCQGVKLTAEHRAKLSAAKLGKKRNPHTAETKAKMSAASKGIPKSDQHRQSMSAQRTGRTQRPCSDQARRNKRQAVIASQPSKTGYRGVYWCKQQSKWRARICVAGKSIHLGVFDDPIDGQAAYSAAERKHFGVLAIST